MEELTRHYKKTLLSKIEELSLDEISDILPGRDEVRQYPFQFGGWFTSGAELNVAIIEKDGLTLTFVCDTEDDSNEELFYESDYFKENEEESSMEEWDGIFTYTLSEKTGILLLLHLANITE